MEIGLVEKVDIDNEMQQAYLDYAMSVIVARALPDARDGLKPVHRRILYAMYDMGLRPETPYKKSARIVGEVLGKYHPHGDMAVYEAMARMAQDFSMRNLLVDGQGNFGSVDGDSPAAMRYTEARLTSSAMRMLADIQKETVNFSPNFDGSLTEPDVLPAALPNLLVNGATGIAVGMSTSIPPHNLGEVVDALKFMLENWSKLDDLSVEDLMHFIKGPDFPTGGVIIQDQEGDGLHSSYGSGRGRVTVQARVRLEEMDRGRSRLIVTELPYMTNKSSLIERIAELVREERLEGIADLRDESDRQGMRIVIELNKAADPEKVLRDLYRHTPMQSTFSIILLALVDGEPRLLSLKQALRVYLDHRLEIVRRRSQYDLEKARQRAHILEGLRIALQHLDEVIDLIRKAPDAETARERLIKRFKLTEIQAQAILDLQLRRLASLERKKIEQEYKEVLALIKELEALLRSPAKMRGVIADELQAVKDAFDDRRRTQIVLMKEGESKLSLLTATDLTPEKTIWLSVTPQGLISRTIDETLPRLSGGDAPAWLVQANTRDVLYLVTERGEAAAVAVHSLPEAENPSEGVPVWKVSALHEGDVLAGLLPLPPKGERSEDWFLLACTCQGMVKKSPVNDLPGPSASTFTVVKVNEGDRLSWLRLTHGSAEVLLATAGGMVIRFSEEDVRPMGLVASGVMGIKFQNGDEIAGMDVLPQPGDVFLLASNGGAKRVPVKDFPRQGRYGQGVAAWKLPEGVRVVGLAVGRGTVRAILHLEKLAPKAIRLDAAPLQSRGTRGQVISEVKGDRVLRLVLPWYTPRPISGGALVGSGGNGEQGGGKQGSRGAATKNVAGEQGSSSKERREPAEKIDGSSEPGADGAKKKSASGVSRAAKTEAAVVKSRSAKASGPTAKAPRTSKASTSPKAPTASKKAASAGPAAASKADPAAKPPAASKKTAASAAAQLSLDMDTTGAAGAAAAGKGSTAKSSRASKTTAASSPVPAKSSPAAKTSSAAAPAAAKAPVQKTSTSAAARPSTSKAKSAHPDVEAPPVQAVKTSTRGKAAAGTVGDAGRTSKTRTKAAEAAAVTAVSGSTGRRKTAADAQAPAVGKVSPQAKASTAKKASASKADPGPTKSSAAAGRSAGSAADQGAKLKASPKAAPAEPAPKASSRAKTTSAAAAKPSPAPSGSKGSSKAATSRKSTPDTPSKSKATSPAAAKGAAPPKAPLKKPSTGKTGSSPKTSSTKKRS